MAKSQENGTRISLGLKDYEIGEVVGSEERVVVEMAIKGKQRRCPYCGSPKLYRHGLCKAREVLHSWSSGKRI